MAAQASPNTRGMARLPRVLIKPLVHQTPCAYDACCGYVSVKAVLDHFRRPLKGLKEELDLKQETGTSPEQLYHSLRSRGLGIRVLKAPLSPQVVREHLRQDQPIILLMRCGEYKSSELHWVTITGQYRGEYRLVDARAVPGPVWLQIKRKQQLFAFATGRFENEVTLGEFARKSDTSRW